MNDNNEEFCIQATFDAGDCYGLEAAYFAAGYVETSCLSYVDCVSRNNCFATSFERNNACLPYAELSVQNQEESLKAEWAKFCKNGADDIAFSFYCCNHF